MGEEEQRSAHVFQLYHMNATPLIKCELKESHSLDSWNERSCIMSALSKIAMVHSRRN